MRLPARKLIWLILILLLTTLSQTMLSNIRQYFIQDQDLFFRIWSVWVPLGTRISQNHFVAFMRMLEPLAINLMTIFILDQNSSYHT